MAVRKFMTVIANVWWVWLQHVLATIRREQKNWQ